MTSEAGLIEPPLCSPGAPVPLVDLAWQARQVADEVQAGFADVVAQSSFVLGPQVQEFEAAFAAYSDVACCVGVANGTDAIELALRACGVGVGDEVLLPANSFVATAGAVVRMGATPVLVDCDPDYLLMDVGQVLSRSGPRTRALLPVHLYGQQANMKALRALADQLATHDRAVLIIDEAQNVCDVGTGQVFGFG